MPFMPSLFRFTVFAQLRLLFSFLFDREYPELIDEEINDGGDDDGVEGGTDIERYKNIFQVFLEPINRHLDRFDTFSAEYEVSGQVLHIIHRRHGDRVAQPDY